MDAMSAGVARGRGAAACGGVAVGGACGAAGGGAGIGGFRVSIRVLLAEVQE